MPAGCLPTFDRVREQTTYFITTAGAVDSLSKFDRITLPIFGKGGDFNEQAERLFFRAWADRSAAPVKVESYCPATIQPLMPGGYLFDRVIKLPNRDYDLAIGLPDLAIGLPRHGKLGIIAEWDRDLMSLCLLHSWPIVGVWKKIKPFRYKMLRTPLPSIR